ncbi:MAG TPA: glycosyltransferase family 2 protein [Thermoleophilaceae bacterium]|jgi:GT2 family glycosyltransferase
MGEPHPDRRARIAVVLIDTDEGELLEETLPLLEAQTRPPDEIVVVDNAASDGSPEWIRERHPRVRIVALSQRAGFAEANNRGVRAAGDCDLVALLNADAFPEPQWLERLEAAARDHPDAAAFSSLMLDGRDPTLLDGTGDVMHRNGLAGRRHHGHPIAETPEASVPADVFAACAGAALYRREVFEALGGFDESYFIYFEDADLSFRMQLLGHGVRYVPGSVVRHLGSATTGVDSDFTIYHTQRNLVWMFWKAMPWPLLVLYLPAHLAMHAGMTWDYVRAGRAGPVLRAKRDALRGLPRVLRERRAIRRRRRVSSRELRSRMEPIDSWFSPSWFRKRREAARMIRGS